MNTRLALLSGFVFAAVSCAASCAPVEFCGARACSVEFAIDASYSMGETYAVAADQVSANWGAQSTKFDYAMRFTRLAAESIPASEKLVTALGTFAPSAVPIAAAKRSGADFVKELTQTAISVSTVSDNSLDKKSLDYFARKRKGPTTLFFITDGDLDKGSYDPFKVLQTFYQNNPKSCVHFISLAQNDVEKALIERLRRASACSTVTSVAEMATDHDRFNALIQAVLYRDCASEGVMEIAGIPFVKKTDKLDKKAVAALEEVMQVIARRAADEPLTVIGWTDTEGDSAYNKRLALSRAQAVKDYLVSKGVSQDRVSVVGAGESDKFDNTSEAGRKLNRRVDIVFGRRGI